MDELTKINRLIYKDNLEEAKDEYVVKDVRRSLKMNGNNGNAEYDEFGRRRQPLQYQEPGFQPQPQQQQPIPQQQRPIPDNSNLDFRALSDDLRRQQFHLEEEERQRRQQGPYFEPRGQPMPQQYPQARQPYFEPQGQPQQGYQQPVYQQPIPVQQPYYPPQQPQPRYNPYFEPQQPIQPQNRPVQIPIPPPPPRVKPLEEAAVVPKKKKKWIYVLLVFVGLVVLAFIGSLVVFYTKFG